MVLLGFLVFAELEKPASANTHSSTWNYHKGESTFALCATCHGKHGEGLPTLGAPPLAGLPPSYVERQLRDFREGRRGSHPDDAKGLLMRPMARVLVLDETLVAVSNFVGTLKPAQTTKPTADLKSPVMEMARTCLACHSGNVEGTTIPPLKGRGAGYLMTQLNKFSAGIRGYHPEHVEGRLMGEIARRFLTSGKEAETMVAHLDATTPPPATRTKGGLALCASCHGSEMRGNRWLGAPSIAGLDQEYVTTQLRNFRAGIRGGHPEDASGRMMSLAARLFVNADEIETIAAEIAGMEQKPQADTIGGDPERGQSYYAVCMACHGLKGEGNKLLHAPSHGPLEDWYALEQLKKFKAGMRGVHDQDLWGKTMVPILATLPNEEAMRDVIAYMRSLAESKSETQNNE